MPDQLEQVAANAPSDLTVPPKEIREGLEKTAGYVARNGSKFEVRIREKNGTDPKFCYLNQDDPYHAYYQWRVSEIKDGRSTAVAAGRENGDLNNTSNIPSESKPKQLPPPPDFEFAVRLPNISAMDLEIMRHTASYVAVNGQAWMTAIAQREMNNYQFDFLRPQHSLHSYFQRLVSQYKSLYSSHTDPSQAHVREARLAEVQRIRDDKYYLLEKARHRANYDMQQAKQKADAEQEAEKEKLEYAQIDWGDFSHVETITFTDEDLDANLEAPTTLTDIQAATLEELNNMTLHSRRIEEAPPDFDPSAQGYNGQPPHGVPSYGAPSPSQDPARGGPFNQQMYPPFQQAQETPEEQLIRERRANRDSQAAAAQAAARQTGPMKIREDYKPRAQQKRGGGGLAKCPNCHQMIPTNEMDQHLRVELLDAQSRESKAKEAARTGTTNLTTLDVAGNLKRLASQRAAAEEEYEQSKRQATDPTAPGARSNGSGSPAPGSMHLNPPTTNIQEQLANIHAKARK